MVARSCAACGTSSESAAICSRCKQVWYCNAQCQRGHWKTHKPTCVAPTANAAAVERAMTAPAAGAAASSGAPVSTVPVKASKQVEASLSEMLGGGGKKGGKQPARSAADTSASSKPLPAVTFSLPPASATASHPLLEVRELPGRGRGFVARSDIAPGTLLLTESSIYAHAPHCNSNEESRIAALTGLTRVMAEQFPAALERLCHHPDHELPEHPSIDQSPLADLSAEQWRTALARVDSNCFTSSRGMMCSPAVSTANHSCYPTADLIIREVPAPAKSGEAAATADATASAADAAAAALSAARISGAAPGAVVEQCFLYAIQPLSAGDEVTINYLGQDSLCRWYAPAMLRQESFESQWQFRCSCSRCEGNKARAIDKTIAYAQQGMDEGMEERYAKLVLAEAGEGAAHGGPHPHKLLQLYRDLYACFDGARFAHNYLLHQLRSMLIFMPAAFDGRCAGTGPQGKQGVDEWVQLVQDHLLTLRSNLLQPPLHSIKADSLSVILSSCDFIGAEAAANEQRARDGHQSVQPNVALRRRVAELAHENDEVYFDDPTFAQLYPDVFVSLTQHFTPPVDTE